jgi:Ser/Thr protein kinase RdoA (MazF antagonist)
MSPAAMSSVGQFFSLTPEAVLSAVERAGQGTTGLCYPLGSLENRVYEVELEDSSRVVVKFYRPGRWGRDTILDEHRLLAALGDAEIPVCAPLPLAGGDTLTQTADGIFFTLFPRTGGRSPDELTGDAYAQLGRLLARIHNVSAHLGLVNRPTLSPATYGMECLATIEAARGGLPLGLAADYRRAVSQLVDLCTPLFAEAETFVVHADCHRGNLLYGREGWFFLDFDDMARGPAVQDLWLLLPARAADCPQELEAMLTGYRQFRPLAASSLRLIEGLRGLRYVRYAAWVASRWDDPAFPRAFAEHGTEAYWQRQLTDLYEQIRYMSQA